MKNNQQGITFIGLMIIFGIIAFFTLITLKVLPLYLDDWKVSSLLQDLKQEPLITQKTPKEIQTLIHRRMKIGYVDHIKPDQFEIEKKDGKLTVSIEYEYRNNVMSNLDVIGSFKHEVVIVAN